MSKSGLTTATALADSSNYTHGRKGYKICKITPHHMAGVLTGKQCARIFQNPNRNASANYCIGNDGDIVCSVEEENRAWTSSSSSNDCQAITIEVSNSSTGGNWPISEKAWNSLVNLCVDICKRYGFRLNYTGDKNGSLTRHNMFANTNCPGPYLQSRFQELADTVNARLDGGQPTPTPSPEPTPKPSGNDTIKGIQQWLNDNYNTGIAVDGYYGSQTKKALVKALQTEFNRQFGTRLAVDGIFGEQSKNACRNIKQGAKGNITRIIQSMLYCKGYNTNGIEGIFGQATDGAVRRFQANSGLNADGVVGKLTFAKLFE